MTLVQNHSFMYTRPAQCKFTSEDIQLLMETNQVWGFFQIKKKPQGEKKSQQTKSKVKTSQNVQLTSWCSKNWQIWKILELSGTTPSNPQQIMRKFPNFPLRNSDRHLIIFPSDQTWSKQVCSSWITIQFIRETAEFSWSRKRSNWNPNPNSYQKISTNMAVLKGFLINHRRSIWVRRLCPLIQSNVYLFRPFLGQYAIILTSHTSKRFYVSKPPDKFGALRWTLLP